MTANAEAAIDETLEKLDIEYIDLMLLHHPGNNDVDAYHAMETTVSEGKIRSIGLSNWYVEELEEFLPQVTITPAPVQNEIHPYYQENEKPSNLSASSKTAFATGYVLYNSFFIPLCL